MLELPECEENAFDGLHCPRWYGGGSCSYCGAVQPKTDCTEPNRAACPRLCIDFCNRAEEASALGVTAAPAPTSCRWEYHWLVELFHRGDAGPSLGRYHTGPTDISHQSRSTTQAHEARRYTKEQAERVAKDLNVHMMACEWRAVEHGFLVADASGVSGPVGGQQ